MPFFIIKDESTGKMYENMTWLEDGDVVFEKEIEYV
jgi:translation initiation factor IF-1